MGKVKTGVSQSNTLDQNLSSKKKSKTKKYIIICILAIICVSVGLYINYFNKNYIYTNKIAQNIFIEGIDVSNLTKDEAIKYINENVVPGIIKVYYDKEIQEISPNEIDL